MSKVKCRYCAKEVRVGDRHHCDQMRKANQPTRTVSENDDGFFVSLAIAAATDNWMLGALAGGSVIGGIAGDALAGDVGSGGFDDFD